MKDETEQSKKVFFELYRMYVDGMEKVSDRRLLANNFFLSVNTALISLSGILLNLKSPIVNLTFILLISSVGILICLIWWVIVYSYKQLNTGKFIIIHEMEKKLPFRLYYNEWKALGEGKDLHKYLPFSHVEIFIPLVFVILYVGILMYVNKALHNIYFF